MVIQMIHNQHCKFYIASCDDTGGIYLCEYKDGMAEILSKTEAEYPMYMTKSDRKLYVILRKPFQERESSGIISFDVKEDKSLVNPSEIISTRGIVACHLCTLDGYVYCVNYLSGSVVRIPDTEVIHSGLGTHSTRQDMPHTHYINTFDGKFLLCCDLGTDSIYVYDKNLNQVSRAFVPEGHGARHLDFANGYVYCVNELKSTVSVFDYNRGKLVYKTTVNALPDDYTGESTAAAIRIMEDYLYVSNRGHNSISVFKIYDGIPKLLTTVDCGGVSPRDFNIFGNLLVCTNENTDNVTFFEITDGIPARVDAELKIKSPLCVIGG